MNKFSVPTLSGSDSNLAINELQKDLDILNDLSLTLKHAHWNVVGENFIAVHEMIDPEVEDVKGSVDEIAERIATLGGEPNGLSTGIQAGASRIIPQYQVKGRAVVSEHLKAIDEQYTAILTVLRESVVVLDNADFVSSNVIQDVIGKLELFQWKVRSHLA